MESNTNLKKEVVMKRHLPPLAIPNEEEDKNQDGSVSRSLTPNSLVS